MIFRHDDVSPSTDFIKLRKMHDFLRSEFPGCEIWNCINMLGRLNIAGSVYPDLPLKHRTKEYFYDIDAFIKDGYIFDLRQREGEKIASHGLLHMDHSQLEVETQKLSILSSCKYLKTDIFVPPFNKFSRETQYICDRYNIRMAKPLDGWKSLETSVFDNNHGLWFFHGWRYNNAQEFIDSIRKKQPILGEKQCAK